jgi:hypothetical protein
MRVDHAGAGGADLSTLHALADAGAPGWPRVSSEQGVLGHQARSYRDNIVVYATLTSSA